MVFEPYLYLGGKDMVFLDILPTNLHLYEELHTKWLHYKPWLPIISSIQRLYGFEHEILMKKKLRKNHIYSWLE